MSYSTPAMVRNALVPSSDGTVPPTPASHTAADLSDAQLLDAIAEADSTIDAYVGGRYTVPVVPIPAGNPQAEDGAEGAIPHPIDYWSRNIAAYNATLTFRGSQDFTDTDPIARRFKATMDALNAVSTGKANLGIPGNTGPSSSVGVGSPYNPYIGDLWTPEDFSLYPSTSPALDTGRGWGPFWVNP